ncbi:tetratricopeptide repeat protein [Streptomyces sp. NPDC056160]|uniref:tetratricopeptide repeat protein n=1 Tax=Streptomyces sp. NPDC056160 TaxID=3345731 RepID=UPI0035DC863C
MNTTYYDHGAPAERWDRARMFFDARDYAGAARVLTGLVEEAPEQTGPRLMLARAYYHSAQLRRAEHELRIVVERDPVEHYARLMLGRTLQRQGRDAEAAAQLRIASALAGEFHESEESEEF